MPKEIKAYLINRLETLDEEISIREREYRKIVKLLLTNEEEKHGEEMHKMQEDVS